MQKIHILQFLPYFPPHKGGLETHAEEWGDWWTKKEYGTVTNVTNDVGHDYNEERSWILQDGEKIGYKKGATSVYLIPSLDIVHNFPFPRFWTRQYRLVIKALEQIPADIVLTRTRFFFSSFLGGRWARKHEKKWVHTEHGSDSVLLESKLKTSIADLYDSTLGRYIFRYADLVTGVSAGAGEFVKKRWNYTKDIPTLYRGIEVKTGERKPKSDDIIRIGFVGRMVKLKGVDLLIGAFETLSKKYPHITLSLVGNGDQKSPLETIVAEKGLSEKITFLGEKPRDWIAGEYLPSLDILVNPSFQEGLPTTVLEGLSAECVVVATDVGGTREISEAPDLILIEKGSETSIVSGIETALTRLDTAQGLSKNTGELKKFTWDNNIALYYSLFHTFLYGK